LLKFASEQMFDEKLHALISRESKDKPIILLDSQDGGQGYLAIGFKRKLVCFGRECRVEDEQGTKIFDANPWESLSEFRKASGWMFGYLGYDLKNHLELLHSQNPDPIQAPDLVMIEPKSLFFLNRESLAIQSIYGSLPDLSEQFAVPASIQLNTTIDENACDAYQKAILQAKQAIFRGDYYEINLSRQAQGVTNIEPVSLYFAMKQRGAVPFGAFLSVDDLSVCCASPERFLRKKGDEIISEPIKGTAAVSENEIENVKVVAELESSDKNKAENLMIVDLVRNDFSRIAKPGSVKVSELFKIYRFPTVFQMVSKVMAEVEPETDPVDIIKACFPMGSMTGAPKISTMMAIEELETYKRGIYSGAIGYFTPHGDFDFNVVIRTVICKENRWYYGTGGAITSDSDPMEEWTETEIKMRALMNVQHPVKRSLNA